MMMVIVKLTNRVRPERALRKRVLVTFVPRQLIVKRASVILALVETKFVSAKPMNNVLTEKHAIQLADFAKTKRRAVPVAMLMRIAPREMSVQYMREPKPVEKNVPPMLNAARRFVLKISIASRK